MQAPVSERWHDDMISSWLHTARSRIAQREAVQYPSSNIKPSSDIKHATLQSIAAADRTLSDAQAAHRARLQAEEDAIERAKQEVRDAYAVDDEAIDAARRALRQEHNSLLPVAVFPPEILRIIFTLCSEIEHPWNPKHRSTESRNGWLGVTHVCQRWRNVALEHSSLWAHIPTSLGRVWTDEFLKRAQQVPLVVRSRLLDPWEVRFVAKNMRRTVHLDVVFNSRDKSAQQALSAVGAAPLLHTLNLEVTNAAPLPADFLGWHAPVLHDVRFTAYLIPMPWTLSIFAHITSLHVENTFNPKTYPLDKFLDGLEGMRELERLKMILHNGGADRLPEENRHHRSVTIVKLAYLELITSPRDAMIIISYLSLPAHAVACYNLRLFGELDLPDQFFPLSLASVHCHADSSAESSNAITRLHISTEQPSRALPGAVITARTDDEPPLTMCFSHRNWPGSVALAAIASAHLRELTLDYDPFESQQWLDVGRRMPALRRLVVKGAAAVSVCAALCSVPPILPALAILVLVDVSITAKNGREAEAETIRLLPGNLAARAEAGTRLEVLDVTQCDLDGAWVARAQKKLLGTRVAWNGRAAMPSLGTQAVLTGQLLDTRKVYIDVRM
ncbi:hypothetical protein FA95DRAFT_1596583 [Auriscalpium vulgare]|uniref:Uncharacterized protein n=1 Tax=Auriscalpium vulgare TaxID=40419 RepID=A0ACB8RQX6_9AGAM|nr:hypothetical protein FA95DRAFT_1596583 [Auriscalpium vulgare]